MTRPTNLVVAVATLILLSVQQGFADDKPVTKFPTDISWGRIVAQRSALELHVTKLPASRVISFPRLNNRMKSVHLEGKTEEE